MVGPGASETGSLTTMISTNWEPPVGATWADRALSVALDSLCSGMSEYCESSFREDGFGDMNMAWDHWGNGTGCGGEGCGTIFGDGQSNTYETEWPDDYTD